MLKLQSQSQSSVVLKHKGVNGDMIEMRSSTRSCVNEKGQYAIDELVRQPDDDMGT